MEAKPNPPNPLKGLILPIVMTMAEEFSRQVGAPVLELEDPAPGLIGLYADHGFVLAPRQRGAQYLVKRL
jgi:hypothetical protein